MLAAPHRLRRSAQFTAAVRGGVRAGRPALVVHLLLPSPSSPERRTTQVGFVVARSVGGSVVRHRVSRRLRALCAARLDRLPQGARVVVRALPPAADATSAVLAADLDRALEQAVLRAGVRADAAAGKR